MIDEDAYIIPVSEIRGHGYRISSRWVGAMPNQIEGRLDDGRLFYFRARHGYWTLRVAQDEDSLYLGPIAVQGEDADAGWWSAAETLSVFKVAIDEVLADA